jgi:hypothetical protein
LSTLKATQLPVFTLLITFQLEIQIGDIHAILRVYARWRKSKKKKEQKKDEKPPSFWEIRDKRFIGKCSGKLLFLYHWWNPENHPKPYRTQMLLR